MYIWLYHERRKNPLHVIVSFLEASANLSSHPNPANHGTLPGILQSAAARGTTSLSDKRYHGHNGHTKLVPCVASLKRTPSPSLTPPKKQLTYGEHWPAKHVIHVSGRVFPATKHTAM